VNAEDWKALFLLILMPVAACVSYPAGFLGLNLANPTIFSKLPTWPTTYGSVKAHNLEVKAKIL
jgi:hypothetical protein